MLLYVAGVFKWLFSKPSAPPPVVVQQPPPIPPGAAGIVTLTLEAYEALQQRRGEESEAQLAGASEEDRTRLASEKFELASRLADIETAYAKAQETITGLRETAERYANVLGAEKLEEARRIFAAGDFDAADSLFARVEDAGDLEVERTAAAAFQRGKIAEEQVRWAVAAEHYAKAARLSPSWDNLERAGQFHWQMGLADKAIQYVEGMVEIAKREGDDLRVSFALNSKALLLQSAGKYDEAEPLYRQAMEIDAKTIGTEHPEYATHLNNLAGLLRDMGRHDEAEPLFRQALEIDAKTIGTAHPEFAKHLNNLALLLKVMGRYAEAEPLYRQAMEIDAKTIGTAHPDYATDLNNLANLLRAMGRYDKAQPLYAQTMPILRGTLGDDHPNTRGGAANYARLLRAHFPDDPALAELEAAFGSDIGR